MKRFDYRILVGAALILGGILMLLDQTGSTERRHRFLLGRHPGCRCGHFPVLVLQRPFKMVGCHPRLHPGRHGRLVPPAG